MSGTMGYGITETGFNRMRMPEIRQLIIEDLQARTGLVFETREDSITGQFIDTFAEREAALWELSEAVYFAMYPVSAFGTNLDHSVSFAGVRRLFELNSWVFAILYGDEGTIVPIGSTVREKTTRSIFLLDNEVTITRVSVVDVTILVPPPVAAGDVFTVTVNANTYSYAAGIGEDETAVAAGLAIALAGSGPTIVTDVNTVRLFNVDFLSFSVNVSANLTIDEIGSGGNFTAEEAGPIIVPIDSITDIVSTMTGWTRVNNNTPGSPGRENETDDELRRRYSTGVFRLGAATLPSIDANLRQNVPGLLALRVYENVDDVIDADGRVPHCIEVVAEGGDIQVIARQIYLLKAAGIDTFGTITQMVLDSNGFEHEINFNKPELVNIFVNVVVTLYSEELFPPDGPLRISRIIVETGNSFGIDKDVIVQRLIGPIYQQVNGIEILDITVTDIDPPAPGDYTTNTIPIGARQLSWFDQARITVTVIP